MSSLGEKIRHFRKMKGFSQEDIAHELDISWHAYSKIERNITDVNYSRLMQISKVLKLSLIELLSVNDQRGDLGRENELLKKQITEKDKEIIKLQNRVIKLLEKRKNK